MGVGWGRADFSQHASAEEVLKTLKDVGRNSNSIRYFFNLSVGDIVVVPLYRAIAIGIVSGNKRFVPEFANLNACNQVSVDFFCNDEGKIIRIPRNDLSEGLSSRLKIRKAIARLHDFREEIEKIIISLKEKGTYQATSAYLEQEEIKKEAFKQELLHSIASGNTRLSAGGNGLERLIVELLKIEGYNANIQAKNQSPDLADIDIKAEKIDRFNESHLFIQVKYHSGISGSHGLNQLIEYDSQDEANVQKWLITTATLSETTKQKAEEMQINTMEGSDLVD